MKQFASLAAVIAVAVLTVVPAWGDMSEFTPSGKNLGDLDHSSYFAWGVNWRCPLTRSSPLPPSIFGASTTGMRTQTLFVPNC